MYRVAWEPRRVAAVHNLALASLFAGVARSPSQAPTLYMTGGGYGSGKSTILNSPLIGFPPTGEALRIDPDAVKALIPEYVQMTANGDPAAATFVHEESSYIAKQGVMDALGNGYDVVYDSSGDSGIVRLTNKIKQFRDAGAIRVVAEYATPGSVQKAQARAAARAQGSNGLRRHVPAPLLLANHYDVSHTWLMAAATGLFDALRLWSTAGPLKSPPSLIATAVRRRIKVSNQRAFDEFLGIGGLLEQRSVYLRGYTSAPPGCVTSARKATTSRKSRWAVCEGSRIRSRSTSTSGGSGRQHCRRCERSVSPSWRAAPACRNAHFDRGLTRAGCRTSGIGGS
jgi:hypothetical protein